MDRIAPFKDALNQLMDSANAHDQRARLYAAEHERKMAADMETAMALEIPKIFQAADHKKVHPKLKDFLTDENNFCWISGGTGTGKTHALYALKKYQIANGLPLIKVVKEIDLNHETKLGGFIAIDDVGLSKNQNRLSNLLELYFSIIEKKYESNTKIIFTSNIAIKDWFEANKLINADIVYRIGSRMSKKTLQIKLEGMDKRKTGEFNESNFGV